MLQDILKADLEEGIVARTKRFLTSLGVTVNIPSRKVYRSNKECDSDPASFLLEIYNDVVEIEAKLRPGTVLSVILISIYLFWIIFNLCVLHTRI